MEAMFSGPAPPRERVVVFLECLEERVGVEPVSVFFEKCVIVAVAEAGGVGFLHGNGGADVSGVAAKIFVGAVKNFPFGDVEPAEVHVILRERSERGDVGAGEEAVALEHLKVDEVGIASEGGETLVGRVTITGRTERANLPVTNAGVLEERNPCIDGGGVERANALRAGKRSRMHEDTGGALGEPVEERRVRLDINTRDARTDRNWRDGVDWIT